jgi:sporadic carbohydrate cluster protein (TIGR04323 family)
MTDAAGRGGYRGYIGSRPVAGTNYPQKVQNLVIRDYAARRGLELRLSLTEYAMPGCYMMLQDALAELSHAEGLIIFSLFMLPPDPDKRHDIYRRIFAHGAVLHAALEELVVKGPADLPKFEDILKVDAWLPHTPGSGYWGKAE